MAHECEGNMINEFDASNDSNADQKSKMQGELLKIAAELVMCQYLPSSVVDDYPQKTYSASRVAGMMEQARAKSKELARRIRLVVDLNT